MKKGKKIGGIILVVLGALGIGIGIIIGLLFGAVSKVFQDDEFGGMMNEQIAELVESGIPTEGTIIEVDSEENLATVEYYSDTDECWYETTMPNMNGNYKVGDTVIVYYDLNNPRYLELEVIAPEMFGDAMGAVGDVMPAVGGVAGGVFGVVGLILLIIGIVLLVTYHKDKKWMNEIHARNAAAGHPYPGAPMGGQPPYQPYGNTPVNGQPNGTYGGQPPYQQAPYQSGQMDQPYQESQGPDESYGDNSRGN